MIATPGPGERVVAGERLEELIAAELIEARIVELGDRISRDYRGKQLHLVVVLKGAFVFAADLVRRIKIPVRLDFIAASSYRGGIRPSAAVTLTGLERLDLVGRHVVVVDDILDTGQTTAAILAAVQRCGPASACICALLRKPRARTGGPPLGYVGFEIGEDFVVGYGMDYGERYRGLCNIYRLLLNNAPRSKRPARGIDVFASLRCAFLRAYV